MKMRKHFHPPFAFAYDAPDNALGKYAVQYRFPASPKGFANYGICRGRSNRLRKKSYYNTGYSGTEGSLRKVSASDGTLYGNCNTKPYQKLEHNQLCWIFFQAGFSSVFRTKAAAPESGGCNRLFTCTAQRTKKGPHTHGDPFQPKSFASSIQTLTVGMGISPIHAAKPLADYTAGRELHPAPKLKYKIDLRRLLDNPPQRRPSRRFCRPRG